MQEFLNDQIKQVKKIAKFDLQEEKQIYKLSVYAFLEHLCAVLDDQPT